MLHVPGSSVEIVDAVDPSNLKINHPPYHSSSKVFDEVIVNVAW
jgi:hypothetical protein